MTQSHLVSSQNTDTGHNAMGSIDQLLGHAPGVAAAGSPVGGCPTGTFNVPHPEGGGWNLEPIGAMVELDVGNKADQNGDGYICQRFNIGLSDKHGFGIWTVKDNNNRVR